MIMTYLIRGLIFFLLLVLTPLSVGAQAPSADALLHDLNVIAAVPRPVGSTAHKRVEQYLTTELRQVGYQVTIQTGAGSSPYSGGTYPVRNIIAQLPGTSTEEILLVAHYDSVRTAPGALDNGTGAAALLAAARQLSQKSHQHTLTILLSDAEENGLVGSYYFVQHYAQLSRVEFVVNLDVGLANQELVIWAMNKDNGLSAAIWQQQSGTVRLSEALAALVPQFSNMVITDFEAFQGRGIPGLDLTLWPDDMHAWHNLTDRLSRASGAAIITCRDALVKLAQTADRTDLRGNQNSVEIIPLPGLGGLVIPLWLGYGLCIVILPFALWMSWILYQPSKNGARVRLIRGAISLLSWVQIPFTSTAIVAVCAQYHHALVPWNAYRGLYVALAVAVGITGWWGIRHLCEYIFERQERVRLPMGWWSWTLGTWIGFTLLWLWFQPTQGHVFYFPLLILTGMAFVHRTQRNLSLVRFTLLFGGILLIWWWSPFVRDLTAVGMGVLVIPQQTMSPFLLWGPGIVAWVLCALFLLPLGSVCSGFTVQQSRFLHARHLLPVCIVLVLLLACLWVPAYTPSRPQFVEATIYYHSARPAQRIINVWSDDYLNDLRPLGGPVTHQKETHWEHGQIAPPWLDVHELDQRRSLPNERDELTIQIFPKYLRSPESSRLLIDLPSGTDILSSSPEVHLQRNDSIWYSELPLTGPIWVKLSVAHQQHVLWSVQGEFLGAPNSKQWPEQVAGQEIGYHTWITERPKTN